MGDIIINQQWNDGYAHQNRSRLLLLAFTICCCCCFASSRWSFCSHWAMSVAISLYLMCLLCACVTFAVIIPFEIVYILRENFITNRCGCVCLDVVLHCLLIHSVYFPFEKPCFIQMKFCSSSALSLIAFLVLSLSLFRPISFALSCCFFLSLCWSFYLALSA